MVMTRIPASRPQAASSALNMLPRSPTCTVRFGSSRPSSTARRNVVAWLMRVPISVSSVSGCASNCTSPTGRSLAIARRIGSGTVWSPPTVIGVARSAVQALKERLDRGEAGRQVHRIDRDVADIGDLAQLERRDPAGRMHQPDGARRLAHGGRAATRAGAVVGAEVERHADQRDVDAGVRAGTRGARSSVATSPKRGETDGSTGLRRRAAFMASSGGYRNALSPATLAPVSTTQETHAHAGRDRILRNVRLRTARPCGAGRDPEDPTHRAGRSAPVRRRRLRDHGGRQARLLRRRRPAGSRQTRKCSRPSADRSQHDAWRLPRDGGFTPVVPRGTAGPRLG